MKKCRVGVVYGTKCRDGDVYTTGGLNTQKTKGVIGSGKPRQIAGKYLLCGPKTSPPVGAGKGQLNGLLGSERQPSTRPGKGAEKLPQRRHGRYGKRTGRRERSGG